MRIGCVVRSYGLTKYLPAVLKSYEWVDKVAVMNHRFRGVKPRYDNTSLIAERFSNTTVHSGENLDQHDVLNAGVSSLSDCDYIFISDADELITRADKEKILSAVSGKGAVKCPLIDYTRDYTHRFPQRDHQAVVIVRPDMRFYDVRCLSGAIESIDVFIHHFGYVYDGDEIAWKIDWEKPWEHNSVLNILGKVPLQTEIPDEIMGYLNA